MYVYLTAATKQKHTRRNSIKWRIDDTCVSFVLSPFGLVADSRKIDNHNVKIAIIGIYQGRASWYSE